MFNPPSFQFARSCCARRANRQVNLRPSVFPGSGITHVNTHRPRFQVRARPSHGTSASVTSTKLGLYKIFFYFESFVHESIVL